MKAYQARLQVSRHRDPFAGIPEAIPSPAPAQRLEDFTIEQLVHEEIVRQEAEKRGITVADKAVQAKRGALPSKAGADTTRAEGRPRCTWPSSGSWRPRSSWTVHRPPRRGSRSLSTTASHPCGATARSPSRSAAMPEAEGERWRVFLAIEISPALQASLQRPLDGLAS